MLHRVVFQRPTTKKILRTQIQAVIFGLTNHFCSDTKSKTMKLPNFLTFLLLVLVALVAGANEDDINAMDNEMNAMNEIEMAMTDKDDEVGHRSLPPYLLNQGIKSLTTYFLFGIQDPGLRGRAVSCCRV